MMFFHPAVDKSVSSQLVFLFPISIIDVLNANLWHVMMVKENHMMRAKSWWKKN